MNLSHEEIIEKPEDKPKLGLSKEEKSEVKEGENDGRISSTGVDPINSNKPMSTEFSGAGQRGALNSEFCYAARA